MEHDRVGSEWVYGSSVYCERMDSTGVRGQSTYNV